VIQNATLPGMPAKGPIGFQASGGPVEVRNVEVRDLSAPGAK
jgi:hypothetical protein